jgi:hypothetical protein
MSLQAIQASYRANSIEDYNMQHLKRQGGWLFVDGQPVTNVYLKFVGECAPADGEGMF